MHHNFGLSPFPLTDRRPTSTNRKRVETAADAATLSAVHAETVSEETAGGDQ
ncbi:MAG: hypothetical protein RLZZ587_65 [Actinomycetota bacterium]|jgi:hypothetical protein